MVGSMTWVFRHKGLTAMFAALVLTACSQNTAKTNTKAGAQSASLQAEQTNSADTAQIQASKYRQKLRDAIEQMQHKTIDTPSAQGRFVQALSAHHQAAITMAYTELRYGKDNQMREFAQAIIDGEQAELQWMRDWQQRAQTDDDQAAQMQGKWLSLQQNLQGKLDQLGKGLSSDLQTPDVLFAHAMLLQNQLAIDLSAQIIKLGADDEILVLAQQNIDDHTLHNNELNTWLKQINNP